MTKSSVSRYCSPQGIVPARGQPGTVVIHDPRRSTDEQRHLRARRDRSSARHASGRCRAGPGPPIRPRHVHSEVGGVPRPQAGNHRAAVGRPGRRGRPCPQRDLDRGTAARGPAVHRYRLERESAAQAARPALPRREPHRRAAGGGGRPRAARPQARAVLPGEPRRGARPQQRPVGEPGLGQGRDRHRGAQPGARGQAAGKRLGLGTAHSGDGRRQRLRPGREHRRDARRRSCFATSCWS